VVSDLLLLMLVFTWYSDKLLSIYGDFIITPLVSLLDNYVLFSYILAASLLHIFGVFFQTLPSTNGILRMFMGCCLVKQWLHMLKLLNFLNIQLKMAIIFHPKWSLNCVGSSLLVWRNVPLPTSE